MLVQIGDSRQGVSQNFGPGRATRSGLIRETGVYSEGVAKTEQSFLSTLSPRSLGSLFVATFNEWRQDKVPQLGAALAYYTVFSLAPLILVLLAVIGLVFRKDPAGAWNRMTEQMSSFLDPSGVQVVQDIASTAAKPSAGVWATIIGIGLALFGASCVFGQLQDALNTIWGVKAKPAAAVWDYLRVRFLSFAMVAGVCFLLLVTLTVEAVLKGLSSYLEATVPGGAAMAFAIYLTVDLGLVVLLFAGMFKYLPDVEVRWRDVWVGAAMTSLLFLVGKWALGLYLGSGAAGSAYGAASSLVTLLLWIYYSSQILLFGAEFTQVYARRFGADIRPSKHAVAVEVMEKEVATPA